jgi:hypothetical protein
VKDILRAHAAWRGARPCGAPRQASWSAGRARQEQGAEAGGPACPVLAVQHRGRARQDPAVAGARRLLGGWFKSEQPVAAIAEGLAKATRARVIVETEVSQIPAFFLAGRPALRYEARPGLAGSRRVKILRVIDPAAFTEAGGRAVPGGIDATNLRPQVRAAVFEGTIKLSRGRRAGPCPGPLAIARPAATSAARAACAVLSPSP